MLARDGRITARNCAGDATQSKTRRRQALADEFPRLSRSMLFRICKQTRLQFYLHPQGQQVNAETGTTINFEACEYTGSFVHNRCETEIQCDYLVFLLHDARAISSHLTSCRDLIGRGKRLAVAQTSWCRKRDLLRSLGGY